MSASQDWRQLLPHCRGLPLLPIGAKPPKRKAPVDPATGYGLSSWDELEELFTPEQIAAMDGGFVIAAGIRCGGDGLVGVDIDGARARDWLVACGADPDCERTWKVGRNTNSHRTKLIYRLTPEQQQQLGQVKSLLRFPEPGQPKAEADALEIYHSPKGQVIVLGQHCESGGHYVWLDGTTPADITAPTPAMFAAMLAWKAAVDVERGKGGGAGDGAAAGRSFNGRTSAPGDWTESGPCNPCPVCGRNTTGACGISRDGRFVSCYEGRTFAAPEPLAGWRPGNTLTGHDGQTWAYIEPQETWGPKRLYKLHEPRSRASVTNASQWPLQAASEAPPAGFTPLVGSNGSNGQGATPPATTSPTALPTEAVLPILRARARALLEQRMPPHERSVILRSLASDHGAHITPSEISQLLAVARQDLRGRPQGVGLGEKINVQRRKWLCEGFLPAGRPTLLVSVPKVGKTTLLCALISAWHYGRGEFLGMPLHGTCPPVLLLGPDMTPEDWADLLVPLGLAQFTAEDEINLLPPIQYLWHSESGIALNEEGFEEIEEKLHRHPGALLIADSYTALTAALGLDEWKAEMAGPFIDLAGLCSRYSATPVVIHHAGKSRAGERASSASRASNALPAAASQVVSLRWLDETGPGAVKRDNRVVLSTEGRGGRSIELVIEQQEGRQWILHGDGTQFEAEKIRARKVEKISRNERQAAVYALLMGNWEEGRKTDASEVLDELADVFQGVDREKMVRNTLDQLLRTHQLIEQGKVVREGRGVVAVYWPAGVEQKAANIAGGPPCSPAEVEGGGEHSRAHARGGAENASLPSLPSLPISPGRVEMPPLTPNGDLGKEGKEASDVPPREAPPDSSLPQRLRRGEETSNSVQAASSPTSADPTSDPRELALQIKALHPDWIASQVANALMAEHGINVGNARVRDWLKEPRNGA